MTSVEYGLSFGVDRAIRELAAAGHLTAIGCLTVSDLWSREYLPLRDELDDAGHKTLVGVTISLTSGWEPVSVEALRYFDKGFPKPRWYGWRSRLRLLPDDTLYAEVSGQIDRFQEYYQRPPDFIFVQDGLLRHAGIARIVMDAVEARKVRPAIVSPFVEDRPALRFRKKLEKRGLQTLPRGRDLPFAAGPEELGRHVWSGFNGLYDQAVVLCTPAIADDRLRRMEPPARIASREVQKGFLESERFNILLIEKDIFLF
ncbi:ChbG/HpnK family deacetylase [Rhizobiales bacterium]|uniref:ChbG/HpnK family deacetylase n=1 Tax=Hongsoonwoonella zoysiae TaxID=2821844 RepID=UPI00156000BF|nr:ChbG/HpnK family deacetylase [Hongsoonwoonella zoysiae]NRG19861.1 ChbG/HpnK family deacetylase [Hongsoonwoonella zoysiae]